MKMYSVRSVLEWKGRKDIQKKHLYEERITVWNANSLDEAIALAEKEIDAYVNEESSKKEKMSPLGFYQAFAGFKEVQLDLQGEEVFSLLRQSDLEPDDYLDSFFDTGDEHQQGKKTDQGAGINSVTSLRDSTT
tara:strand:+ start:686 stop:1087 length:402 start_codon:yes stop_codon:yes gene_type:complete